MPMSQAQMEALSRMSDEPIFLPGGGFGQDYTKILFGQDSYANRQWSHEMQMLRFRQAQQSALRAHQYDSERMAFARNREAREAAKFGLSMQGAGAKASVEGDKEAWKRAQAVARANQSAGQVAHQNVRGDLMAGLQARYNFTKMYVDAFGRDPDKTREKLDHARAASSALKALIDGWSVKEAGAGTTYDERAVQDYFQNNPMALRALQVVPGEHLGRVYELFREFVRTPLDKRPGVRDNFTQMGSILDQADRLEQIAGGSHERMLKVLQSYQDYVDKAIPGLIRFDQQVVPLGLQASYPGNGAEGPGALGRRSAPASGPSAQKDEDGYGGAIQSDRGTLYTVPRGGGSADNYSETPDQPYGEEGSLSDRGRRLLEGIRRQRRNGPVGAATGSPSDFLGPSPLAFYTPPASEGGGDSLADIGKDSTTDALLARMSGPEPSSDDY